MNPKMVKIPRRRAVPSHLIKAGGFGILPEWGKIPLDLRLSAPGMIPIIPKKNPPCAMEIPGFLPHRIPALGVKITFIYKYYKSALLRV